MVVGACPQTLRVVEYLTGVLITSRERWDEEIKVEAEGAETPELLDELPLRVYIETKENQNEYRHWTIDKVEKRDLSDWDGGEDLKAYVEIMNVRKSSSSALTVLRHFEYLLVILGTHPVSRDTVNNPLLQLRIHQVMCHQISI